MEKNQSNFLISSFALRACIQKKIKEEEKKLYIFEAMNLIKLKYPKIITDVQYKEALGKGNLYITKLENDSNGYYHFSTSDIHVSSDNIDSSDKDFIHKVIHKLYLRHTAENVGFSNIEFILNNGILEGATELISARVTGIENKSCIENGITFNMPKKILNKYQVAIVSQMEYLIGNELLEKMVLTGLKDFIAVFCMKYGVPTYIYVREKISVRKNIKINDFFDAQKVIIENCFDIKFKNAITLKEKYKVLKELKEFEKLTVRASDNNFFEEYYNLKYNELLEKYKKHKYSTKELEELKYTPYEFYKQEKEIKTKTETLDSIALAKELKQNKEKFDIKEYFSVKADLKQAGKNVFIHMVSYKGKIISGYYSYPEIGIVRNIPESKIKEKTGRKRFYKKLQVDRKVKIYKINDYFITLSEDNKISIYDKNINKIDIDKTTIEKKQINEFVKNSLESLKNVNFEEKKKRFKTFIMIIKNLFIKKPRLNPGKKE